MTLEILSDNFEEMTAGTINHRFSTSANGATDGGGLEKWRN